MLINEIWEELIWIKYTIDKAFVNYDNSSGIFKINI